MMFVSCNSNTSVTHRAGIVDPPGEPELASVFSGARVARSFLCSVFVFVIYHLSNVFSVLRFTISDYLPLVSSNSSSLEPMNKLNTTMHLYSLEQLNCRNVHLQ